MNNLDCSNSSLMETIIYIETKLIELIKIKIMSMINDVNLIITFEFFWL